MIRILHITIPGSMIALACWLFLTIWPMAVEAETCQAIAVREKQQCWLENLELERHFDVLSGLSRHFEPGSALEHRAFSAGEETIRIQYDLDKLNQGYEMILMGSDGYCRSRINTARSIHQALIERMEAVSREINDLSSLSE